MNKRSKYPAFLFPVFFIMMSCFSLKQSPMELEYFVIEYENPEVRFEKTLPVILRVEPFRSDPLYSSNHMIYRDEKFKRNSYHYFKWRVSPEEMVSSYLKQYFSDAGLFMAVFSEHNSSAGDFILEGVVDEFLEWDHQDFWETRISITVTLVPVGLSKDRERVVFQKCFTSLEPCKEKTPAAVAESMSVNTGKIARQIAAALFEHLKDY